MKKMISLALGAVAVLALSGCSGDNNEIGCNTLLKYTGYTNGSSDGAASSIKLINNSDYVIEQVYSGVNGDISVSSVFIPTDPGEYFIANSASCDSNELLRIIDDESCEQEIVFFRGCDETANFEVVNNF